MNKRELNDKFYFYIYIIDNNEYIYYICNFSYINDFNR